jgi:hypothetical protein
MWVVFWVLVVKYNVIFHCEITMQKIKAFNFMCLCTNYLFMCCLGNLIEMIKCTKLKGWFFFQIKFN